MNGKACLHISFSVFMIYALLQLLELSVNLVGDFLELLFREFEVLLAEVHVSLAVHRDEMDVGMRNLQTNDSASDRWAC